jgi:hypothetical protein
MVYLLSFKRLFIDTLFIRFEIDELSKWNIRRKLKIRSGTGIDSGNGGPL